METGLPTGSIMKYNSFVNPFLVKLTLFVTIHYNTGHTYTINVQELVKEVTLKKHTNKRLAILHGIKLSP